MNKDKQWILPHHKPYETSDPLSRSLPRQASMVKQGNNDSETTNINLRISSAASNTILSYEDVSVDYSQYYKESPITFEDLLSDESNTSNISSVSEEEGYADEPGAAHLTTSEDRNALRAITYHKYKILQLCFTGWWRTVVAKHQRAMEFHRRRLLQQGLKALRWNMMIGKELAKMGVWHHQRWKHRCVFLKWKSAALMKRHKRMENTFYLWRHLARLKISSCVSRLVAQRKTVQVSWTRWKLTLQSVRQERVAVQHSRVILLRKSFTAFLINANLNKQKQLAHELSEAFHNTVIRRDCFMHWKFLFHNTSTARRHCEHNLLLRSMRKWRENTVTSRCQCLQLQEQAEQHWCASSLKHSFSRWHVQLLERKALKFSKVLLLSRYFHLWNSHRKLIQHNTLSAESFYTEVTIKNAFSQWKMKCLRVQVARVSLEALLQKEILQRYFDSWKSIVSFSNSLRAIQQEFVRQHNAKTLILYFTCWQKSFAAVRHNKAADNLCHLHLKQCAFSTWRLFIYQQTLRHASRLFIMERQRNLLQKYFDQWVCETACSVGENVISTRLFSTLCLHRLRKAFLAWRQATRTSQAATRTQRICLRKFFCKWQQKWRARCMANNTLTYSAEVSVVKRWFDKWRARLQLQILTRTADKHYTSVLLKKTYHFLTMEYKRRQAAKRFLCSVRQSSLVACFVRWKAVLFTRRQLEGMKRSVKFQQHHLVGKCFTIWLKFTRVRSQQLNGAVDQLNTVLTNHRQLTAWRTWKRQLLCHQITRDHLKRKNFYCIQQCFYHWRTITEQSLESLSATFIAKFHVQALSAGGNAAGRESYFHEILLPRQDTPKTVSQYQMNALSLKSSAIKNSFIDIPVQQSTPVLSLCNKRTNFSLSNEASYLQIERDVKRQLFCDTDKELIQTSHTVKLSPPCHCLNPEVVNQLTSLQQDLDCSMNKLESNFSQGSSSVVSPELTSDVILSPDSDNIISPPMEFSEQCNLSSSPISNIETVSTLSTQECIESNSNIVSHYFSNKVTLDHSYLLFNKLISIVKLIQHYPVSMAFVAWHRFVQKRKSLAVLRTRLHCTINHNILVKILTLWKLRTCEMLEYRQLEVSFLANSQNRILSTALQKWITVYHKQLKDRNVLDKLLILRNQQVVKDSFFKWKHNFEINNRIRNHMANGLMLKCLHSWRDYCISKRMVKAKVECVQTKLKHATLLRCLEQWSNEARQTRTLRVCLHHWNNYAQVRVQHRLASVTLEERQCSLLKQRVFIKWKCITSNIMAIQKLHHQNILKSTFGNWKSFTVRRREELFHQQEEKDRRILTVTLAQWRKITKETRLAKRMNCLRLLHYGWKKWRYRIKQEQVSLRIAAVDNAHLMKKVFNAWRCVTLTVVDDSSLLVVEEDAAVLSLYFNQWRIKYMQKTHKIR